MERQLAEKERAMQSLVGEAERARAEGEAAREQAARALEDKAQLARQLDLVRAHSESLGPHEDLEAALEAARAQAQQLNALAAQLADAQVPPRAAPPRAGARAAGWLAGWLAGQLVLRRAPVPDASAPRCLFFVR
jgi:colicin import membrane protein